MVKSYLYIGTGLILLGVIVGVLNYLFHFPTLTPKWYGIRDMLRFSELQIILTIIGVALILYGRKKGVRM